MGLFSKQLSCLNSISIVIKCTAGDKTIIFFGNFIIFYWKNYLLVRNKHLGQFRLIFMEVLQNWPNMAINCSSTNQFKNLPLFIYLADKSAIWQQWISDVSQDRVNQLNFVKLLRVFSIKKTGQVQIKIQGNYVFCRNSAIIPPEFRQNSA